MRSEALKALRLSLKKDWEGEGENLWPDGKGLDRGRKLGSGHPYQTPKTIHFGEQLE